MDDDEFRASKLRSKQFQHLAKNPTDEMTVYRLQGGSDESLGIHWTTDPTVAHHTGIGAAESDRRVHRGTVSKENIIRQGEWKSRNIRSYNHDDPTATDPHPSQWGWESEAEVRLRPGSTVRDHSVTPVGDHEGYTPSGREPTIEDRGYSRHIDIAHAAVQGTPEANRLHMQQGVIPHKQTTMFDTVEEPGTGKVLGHIPKMNLLPGSRSDQISQSLADEDRVALAAGHDDYTVFPGHEPMLGELRQPPAEEKPQVHKRVANQAQFEGMEGF